MDGGTGVSLSELHKPALVEFVDDCRRAVSYWRRAPLLPLLTAAVHVGLVVASREQRQFPPLAPVVLAGAVAAIGLPGVQRLWYLRLARGGSMTVRELVHFGGRFFGRYFWLGLVITTPFAVMDLTLLTVGRLTHSSLLLAIAVLTLVYWVVLDFGLTFVTPALAFNTRLVSAALKLGLKMLRETWPRSAWYALFPPLALQLLLYQPQRVLVSNIAAVASIAVVASLVALAVKGATVEFYMRHVDNIPPNGSADPEPATRVPTPVPDPFR